VKELLKLVHICESYACPIFLRHCVVKIIISVTLYKRGSARSYMFSEHVVNQHMEQSVNGYGFLISWLMGHACTHTHTHRQGTTAILKRSVLDHLIAATAAIAATVAQAARYSV